MSTSLVLKSAAVVGIIAFAALISLRLDSEPDLAAAEPVNVDQEAGGEQTRAQIDELVGEQTPHPNPWTLLEAAASRPLSAEELADRRLQTVDALPPPANDVFVATIQSPPPAEVLGRSSWEPECPVGPADLAYLQVSFFGFDGLFHTGELLVAEAYAEPISEIFASLHERRFPIERMIIVSTDDFGDPANAYTNNTSSFECRRSVSSGRWSRHAYGDAIDINPFHNPYVSGQRVIPALADAYTDRDREAPGLINSEIAAMFEEIGWGWGGNWNSSKDWMHFSATGT